MPCSGHGLIRLVDRVWPSSCTGRSFDKPGPIQSLGQLDSRSTRWTDPGLITIIKTSNYQLCGLDSPI